MTMVFQHRSVGLLAVDEGKVEGTDTLALVLQKND